MPHRVVGALMATALLASCALWLSPPIVAGAHAPGAPAASAAGSRLVPVGPLRLADTRLADCGCQRLDATTIRVDIAGRSGIATDITAAAITVTAADAAAPTYVTAWPSGAERPGTSTVNIRPGAAVANSAIIPVGVDGSIDVFAPSAVSMIIDVSAVFAPAASAASGRFVPTAPVRLLDTREGSGPLPPGGSVSVPLPAGAPADSLALMVNVTSVDAPVAGFLTGRAAGAAPSTSSFVNPDGSGAPVAASVVLPASPGGITIDTSSGGNVLVDVIGWFTGSSAPSTTTGLFVATAPTRLLDTRADGPRLWAGGAREIASPATDAAALVTNVTLDQADAPGFVTAYPAGTPRPGTSSVNAPIRNATVANLAVVTASDRGAALFANAGTDVIVDLTGWFTGVPVAATEPVPPDVAPTLSVLMIGDSTLAALDVVPQSQRALRGFTPILDAAPCRRLVQPSCRSAYTGQVPDTAVHAIATTPQPVDVLVMKAGYNEGTLAFQSDVEQVLLAARARGVHLVLWLTYSEGTGTQLRRYDVNNATIRRLAASGAYPELQVVDWRAYADASSGWYAADHVHLQGAGAWATADYVSRLVAHHTHRPCPTPWAPGGALTDPCEDPNVTAAAIGLPDLRGLYGF
jgi:hypothetical protein